MSLDSCVSAGGQQLVDCLATRKTWDRTKIVRQRPRRVSGAWAFKGTRVPISALFENLKAGASID